MALVGPLFWAEPAGAVAESAAPADGTARSAAAATPSAADAPSPEAPPSVSAERPYRPGARPRPQGAVQASVLDEELARWNVGGTGDPSYPSNRASFHPAPRVLVDVNMRTGSLPKRSKTKGVLSEASLVAQARNAGYWPFRLCFEEGLRRDPSLRGKTRVKFTVETNGHVKSDRMAFTELKDHGVAKCLAARVHAMHFSPAPARRVHADATVDLNPGDAPLPDSTVTAPDAPDGSSGKIDENLLATAFAEPLKKIADCYATGLAHDAKLWGRIAVLVDVDADGRVQNAAERDSRFPDKAVVACAVDAVRQARLSSTGSREQLIWAVRLGNAPVTDAPSGRSGAAANAPETKRTVAEAAPPRVPVAK